MRMEFPRRFIEDCLECDCDVGEPIEWKRRAVVLEMNDEQRAELKNRAEYYADRNGPDADGLQGLKASARAVLKRLEA